MRSFKWIRLPVFCILAALILIAMDYALYPCTFMRNDIHAVTTQTFDDIYMGTSHGKINIDPESVGLQSSRTGHNLCVGGEYPQDCIYMLRLMIEKGHKPERIVYEISPGYLVREKEEGNNYLLFYHEFPVSLAKLSYFMHSVAKCNFRTLFFPWYEYPLSYELANIRDTVRTKWEQDYSADRFRTASQEYHDSGFIARYAVDTSTFTTDDLTPTPVSQIVPENMEQLKKLVEAFAQDYREVWEYLGAFFEGEQVPWINFNDTEHFNLFTHDISAFTDMDGHMNEAAARAFSGVLAGQLDRVDP